MRLQLVSLFVALPLLGFTHPVNAADLEKNTKVELQPLAAQAQRIADALDLLGSPLPESDKETLRKAASEQDQNRGVEAIQRVLDKHCLARVRVMPEKAMEVISGPARPELAEQGWRIFLVKVDNTAGVAEAELRPASANA